MGHNQALISVSPTLRIQMTTIDAHRATGLRRGARLAFVTFAAMLLLTTSACARPAAAVSDDEAIAVATRFLDLFDAGKVAEAREAFSVDMLNTLSVEDLQQSQATYARRGAESIRGEPRVERIDDAAVVEVPVRRGTLVMQATITVGPDRRIEGLFYSLDESRRPGSDRSGEPGDAPGTPGTEPDVLPDAGADAGAAA